ncbi:uncharacterized protein LOC114363847 [Ostrinia furnacalis]|uniref:uncharacterized protein LOC114363847 n=1 Tax=Ostrinia furnacalis TaxID=93504 RepID=UPI00103E9FC3|nr:uncharacterized protein LOC114363847 [Ostrinia furnacalis]
MALSKYAIFLADSSPFFAQDILENTRNREPTEPHTDANRLRLPEGYYENIRKSKNKFIGYTGVSIKVFDYILGQLDHRLRCDNPNRLIYATEPQEKLFLTLRHLFTGISLYTLAPIHHVCSSSANNIMYETCNAINDILRPLHMPRPTKDRLKLVAEQYWQKFKFPNCVGVIDERILKGKKKLPRNPKPHLKKHASYAVHAIVDANYKFLAVDVIGRENIKEETFCGSDLNRQLRDKEFEFPPPQKLPNSNKILPYVIIGHRNYPLRPYLLRPFLTSNHTVEMKKFNKLLLKTKKTIDYAFRIWFNKWRNYLNQEQVKTTLNTKLVVETLCVLHNVVRDIDGNDDIHYKRAMKTPIKVNIRDIKKYKKNNRTQSHAQATRDSFLEYIATIPLQEEEQHESNLEISTTSDED